MRVSGAPGEVGSGWVTGVGSVHVGAVAPTVEQVARAVLQSYGDDVRRYSGTPNHLWFVADAQGTIVAHGAAPAPSAEAAADRINTEEAPSLIPGYDTLRVAMITLLGPRKLGANSPPVLWVQLRGPGSTARETQSAFDAHMAALLRPQIRNGLQQYYPSLLGESRGPALDVWLGHDAQNRVVGATQAATSGRAMDADQIRGALAQFRPGHDGWEVVDRAALRGVVRDNVRVVWVSIKDGDSTKPYFDPGIELLRATAQRFEPQTFADTRPGAAVALVFDVRDSVIAHATGIPGGGRRPCSDVLRELLPQFGGSKFGSEGCAMFTTDKPAVYWGSLRPRR